MDKQKQIEEMAKETCGQQIYPCGDDRPFCFLTHEVCKCCEDNQCDHYEVCERIYNAGYRKIPENAVVIETAIYESLEVKNYRDIVYEQARKETAEKFAERLKAVLVKAHDYYVKLAERNHNAGNEEWYHRWEGEATATQKSIDLMDQICKEITEGAK